MLSILEDYGGRVDRKTQIKVCLDEIESSFGHMEKKSIGKEALSKNRGWVKKHKDILKDLKYKGKMPRQKKGN